MCRKKEGGERKQQVVRTKSRRAEKVMGEENEAGPSALVPAIPVSPSHGATKNGLGPPVQPSPLV